MSSDMQVIYRKKEIGQVHNVAVFVNAVGIEIIGYQNTAESLWIREDCLHIAFPPKNCATE